MTGFTLHTKETAPETSKPLLAKSNNAFGMIPGLHAMMAEAPVLLEACQTVHELFVNASFNKDHYTKHYLIWS